MDRREFLKTAGIGVVLLGGSLAFPNLVIGNPNNPSNLEEYCFSISPHKSIAMRSGDTTPEEFVRKNPNVKAAINGPYYGSDNRTEGIAYLANDLHFATEKPEHTRGYFSVNRRGDKIKVEKSLDGKLNDYFLVLGTHPLLIRDGKIHSQSLEKRYGDRRFYRSAVGTKTGKDICFAVSTDEILMSEWAQRLKDAGYNGALNLDGGPISQMAIKDKDGRISVKGKGTGNTKLVIFSYNR
jgi:exopolysaccharide biosynthesis protein